MQNIYIRIENAGEADPLSFHLLGASSKRDDASKIGFFGSGNKYALAVLLRKNIKFRIFSGKQEIKFGVEKLDFRGNKYNVITIDGQRTSLTTDMGPTWEDWFVIREFYCNAVDEGEARITVTNEIDPNAGKTTIFIEKTEELGKFFSNVNRYLLVNPQYKEKIDTEYGLVSILEKFDDEFICYRKGIRVYPENKMNSLYRYDFDRIQINESRVVMYEHEVQERIACFFAGTMNPTLIKNYMENWQDHYEAEARWDYCGRELSPAWYDALKGRRVYPENMAVDSGDFEGKANSIILPNKLAYKISQQFKDIHVVGYDEKEKESMKELEMTEQEATAINMAIQALQSIGYPFDLPVAIANFNEDDVIGCWHPDRKRVYLSRKHFTDNQSVLQNTLLEEFFHSKGQRDGQRSFVTFLIDELIQAKKVQYGQASDNSSKEN